MKKKSNKHSTKNSTKSITNYAHEFLLSRKAIILTSLAILLVYIIASFIVTSPYSLGYGDSSELVSAAYLQGLPHPPSYPLYMFIGYFVTHISFLTPAYEMNLLSGLFHAVAIVFIFLTLIEILKIDAVKKLSHYSPDLTYYSALAGSLILGFSYYFFLFSGIAEVFPLNDMLIAIALFLSIKISLSWEKGLKVLVLLFLLLSIDIGFMLSNQQTSILLIPPILILLLITLIFSNTKKRILKGFFFSLLCLVTISIFFALPYLYIFTLSASHTVFSWGHATNIHDILNIILRRDYSPSTISRGANAVNTPATTNVLSAYKSSFDWGQIWSYFGFLISYFGIAFFIALAGILSPIIFLKNVLGKNDLIKFYSIYFFILFAFFLSGLFLAAYTPINFTDTGTAQFFNDTEIHLRLYLQSQVIFSLLVGVGIFIILRFITSIKDFNLYLKSNRSKQIVLLLLTILLPIILLFNNIGGVINKGGDIYDLEAVNSLESTPKGSIIVCYSDVTCFPYAYEHYVMKVRPDVILVSVAISKYSYNFSKKYPGLIHTKVPSDNYIIEDIIARNIDKRAIFLSYPSSDNLLTAGAMNNPFNTLPYGYLFRVVRDPSVYTKEEFDKSNEIAKVVDNRILKLNPDPRDYRATSVREAYATMRMFQAYILFNEGHKEDALASFAVAKQISNMPLDLIPQLDNYFATKQSATVQLNTFDGVFQKGMEQYMQGKFKDSEGNFLSAHMLEPDNLDVMKYFLLALKKDNEMVTYNQLLQDYPSLRNSL